MFRNTLKKFDWKNHKRALLDTFYMCVFTFLPTLFAIISLIVNDPSFFDNSEYKAGESFLYSISFFTSSFLIYNKLSFKLSDLRTEFNILILIATILVAYFFSATTAAKNPNVRAINWISTTFLLFSVASFYHSQFLNNKDSPNVREKRNEEQGTIMDGLVK